MIKLIIFTALAFIFAFGVVWLLDNNGTILIDWLGYQLKSDVITTIAILIIFYYLLAIFSITLSRILSFSFAKFFNNLLKKRKLQYLAKSVEYDKKSFELIFDIIKFLEERNENKALETHKELIKFNYDKNLNEILLAKILFQKGELKKSQEIFSKLQVVSKSDFSEKNKKTLMSKLKNFFVF